MVEFAAAFSGYGSFIPFVEVQVVEVPVEVVKEVIKVVKDPTQLPIVKTAEVAKDFAPAVYDQKIAKPVGDFYQNSIAKPLGDVFGGLKFW